MLNRMSGPSEREAALRVEVEELRERVRQLEDMLAGDFDVPAGWPLSPQQTGLVRVLLSREMVATEVLLDIANRTKRNPSSDERCDKDQIRVVICNIRRKLQPYGISIRTQWGFGYYIPAEQRAAVKSGEVELWRGA